MCKKETVKTRFQENGDKSGMDVVPWNAQTGALIIIDGDQVFARVADVSTVEPRNRTWNPDRLIK